MSQTLTISDALFRKLQEEARRRGLDGVESILNDLLDQDELRRRREAVHRIDEIRGRIFAEHGEMPDSIDLIREDRAR